LRSLLEEVFKHGLEPRRHGGQVERLGLRPTEFFGNNPGIVIADQRQQDRFMRRELILKL